MLGAGRGRGEARPTPPRSRVDPEQLRRDLLPSLAESGQELRMRWPVAPSAPHPILLADELQGQSVEGISSGNSLDIIVQRGRSRRTLGVRQRNSRSMQMSSTSRRYRSGPADGGGRPGSPRSRAGREVARPARSGGLAIRIPRQSSSEPSGQELTDPGERSSHGAFRAARVLRDLRELQALQPEFQHPPPEEVELREHPFQLVGQCEPRLRGWDPAGVRRSLPSSTRSRGTSTSTDRRSAPWRLACRSSLCLVMDASSRQRSPPSIQREAALAHLDEEAPIDRQDDVLRVRPPRQPGREPAAGQRGQPFEVAVEERPPRPGHPRPGIAPAGRATSMRPDLVRPHRRWPRFRCCVETPSPRGSPGLPDAVRAHLILTDSGPSLAAPAAERALPDRENDRRPSSEE